MDNRWYSEGHPNADILCTSDGYLAVPYDRVGMNHLKHFATKSAAVHYANTPTYPMGSPWFRANRYYPTEKV